MYRFQILILLFLTCLSARAEDLKPGTYSVTGQVINEKGKVILIANADTASAWKLELKSTDNSLLMKAFRYSRFPLIIKGKIKDKIQDSKREGTIYLEDVKINKDFSKQKSQVLFLH